MVNIVLHEPDGSLELRCQKHLCFALSILSVWSSSYILIISPWEYTILKVTCIEFLIRLFSSDTTEMSGGFELLFWGAKKSCKKDKPLTTGLKYFYVLASERME